MSIVAWSLTSISTIELQRFAQFLNSQLLLFSFAQRYTSNVCECMANQQLNHSTNGSYSFRHPVHCFNVVVSDGGGGGGKNSVSFLTASNDYDDDDDRFVGEVHMPVIGTMS